MAFGFNRSYGYACLIVETVRRIGMTNGAKYLHYNSTSDRFNRIDRGTTMSNPLIVQTLPPFDELVELAQENPEAFRQFKRDMCEELIRSASYEMQDRLWAQQSHIDRVVGRCKNPNQANVVLMQELVSQMIKFQDIIEQDRYEEPKQSADIIPFDSWR